MVATAVNQPTLAEILGIEFPFIQGGMANIATGEFAAASSNAGAMGVIASGAMRPEVLRENIRKCKELTDKPFGVNVMLMHRQVDEIAQVIAEEKVPFITTGAGNPGKYVAMWKESGALVFPVVPSVAMAKYVQRSGADGVIAEGTESGGHVGELTTMALVPQVVDAVDIPVVAAGGIASGAQYLAARALGAIGAQVGTCLLVSEECPIHEEYKKAVIGAKDTSTMVYGRTVGAPVRSIKNRMSRDYAKLEMEGATRDQLEELTLGALRRAVNEGDTKTGSLMSGQVAGQLTQIRPLRQIFKELYADACTLQASLADARL